VTERKDIELSDYLPYLINRVGSALVARYEVELKRYGLSIAMWRVMVALSHGGSQRQIDIAEMTSIDVSTLSRLVTRMTRMGIVSRTRSDTNNREVIVELTAKGRAQLNRLIPIGRGLEQQAVAGLPSADLAATRAALRHMYENLAGIPGAKAPPAGRSAVKVRVSG
jgi:MarR family transcriptional regulator, organic hydroperoxide resistance regulator